MDALEKLLPRTDENAAYWRMFVQWLETEPGEDRVQMIQLCIQQRGPAPDELRPRIEALLKS